MMMKFSSPTNEEVSVNLIYKSSKVLLQEARLKPPTKTLLEQSCNLDLSPRPFFQKRVLWTF